MIHPVRGDQKAPLLYEATILQLKKKNNKNACVFQPARLSRLPDQTSIVLTPSLTNFRFRTAVKFGSSLSHIATARAIRSI